MTLITGVAGFIGFHVAEALLARGERVVGVDNLNDYYDVSLKEARLARLKKRERFSFIKADVADQESMEALFTEHRPSKVLHLAAQAGVRYSIENPFAYEHANGLGTLTLLELSKQHGVTQFVFGSSSSVYGANEPPFSEEQRVDTPISVYAATKRYGELLCRTYHELHGLPCTCLRFFTVYGPWGRPDMALFTFTKSILAGEPIQVFNEGKHKRDFTYVEDIVQGILAALDKPFGYEVFNLARGESRELRDFIAAIERATGKEAELELLPMQPGDVHATSASIGKAKRLLGYEPRTSMEEGVKAFVEWYRDFY